jgi:hypothetical protein
LTSDAIIVGIHDIARGRARSLRKPERRKIYEDAYRKDLKRYGKELTLAEANKKLLVMAKGIEDLERIRQMHGIRRPMTKEKLLELSPMVLVPEDVEGEIAIDNPRELGRIAEILYGVRLVTIRFWFHWKDYVIGGVPDGITDEYVYEFKATTQTGKDALGVREQAVRQAQLYKLIHGLYHKAGLLRAGQNGGYDLRVHSLRRFFKTQLMALGVQPDYIDYMMGHTVNTYHDIQSKGVEFLRNLYSGAALSIRPRSHYTKIDMLKEMMRAWGLEPEKILTSEALAEPHRVYVSPEEREKEEIRLLGLALKDQIKKEFLASV